MSKQEEIKQALAAATPGPWEVINLGSINIAKGYSHIDGKHTAQWIAEMDVQEESELEQAEADAELIAKAPEYIAYLLACVEGLEVSKEIEIENHAQSCFDYQAQIQTLHDENQSLRRSLTSEAVKDANYNVELVRLRKELEIKDSTIETLTKQITDEVAISAAAIVERDRLRKGIDEIAVGMY
ncbi:hypothetical protein [Paenibacillus pabuli]|uniref:hypothetical protein n=1 Tax=Paenibacillus pabuli TaxID=1472 RepID=UPI001FFE59A7|nr:hypothetical protein [Paenibacillus pabuli]UPK42494.1 hypothetical protein KET34_25390 [Paenibacillus pabuli]